MMDVYTEVLYYALKHNGVFKTIYFRELEMCPNTWYAKTQVLEYMLQMGWLRRYRTPGARIFLYQMTEKGRIHLEEHI